MENPSTISTRFGRTDNGIFIFLDNLVWLVYALSCGIYWSLYPDPNPDYWDWLLMMTIYFFVWGVSVLLETLGTIRKHKISMITGIVLTLIIIGFSATVIGVFSELLELHGSVFLSLDSIFFASVTLWNLFRLAFQIKVIRLINNGNINDHPIINLCGSCGEYAKNIRIPLLPQTANGYQSI